MKRPGEGGEEKFGVNTITILCVMLRVSGFDVHGGGGGGNASDGVTAAAE